MTKHITIEGNVTGDVQVRDVQIGQNTVQVASFSIAANTTKNEQGEWVEKGSAFFRCSAWRGLGVAAANNLRKGTPVVISGTLEFGGYTSKDSGERVDTLEIQVDAIGYSLRYHDVQGGKRQAGGGQGSAGSVYGQPQTAANAYGQPAQQPQQQGQGWGTPPAGDPWGQAPAQQYGQPQQQAAPQQAPQQGGAQAMQGWAQPGQQQAFNTEEPF